MSLTLQLVSMCIQMRPVICESNDLGTSGLQGKVVWEGAAEDFDTTSTPIVQQFRSGALKGPIRFD